jgi:MFS family permease
VYFIHSFFPALNDANIRRYLTGQLASVIGAWTQNITLNLVAYQISGSPALLGVLNFLLFGPAILAGPIAGSRVTVANARLATLALLAASLVNGLLLTVLYATQSLTMNVILVLAAVSGLLTAMEMPARQVLITVVSAPGLIGNAVSMNTLTFNAGRMIGPALAAALAAHAGVAYGFLTNVLGIGFMLWCVAGLRISQPAMKPASGGGRFAAALAYARANRMANLFLPVLVGLSLFASGFQTLVPVLADKVFGDAAAYTGVFFGASGCGALMAALLLSSRLSAQVTRWMLVPAPWAAALALLLVGASAHWLLASAGFLLLGFAVTLSAPGVNAKLQQDAPPHLRGPLSGIYVMCYMGLLPFGQLLAGALAEALPVGQVFICLSLGLSLWLSILFYRFWRRDGVLSF